MFSEPKCSTLASPILEEKTDTEEQLEIPWKVIVLNDPVNLMNYVVMVFRKVFGFAEQKAIKHMKEVHELGKSILWVGEREQVRVQLAPAGATARAAGVVRVALQGPGGTGQHCCPANSLLLVTVVVLLGENTPDT